MWSLKNITWGQFLMTGNTRNWSWIMLGIYIFWVLFSCKDAAPHEKRMGPTWVQINKKLTVSICSILFSTRKWCAISLRSLVPPAVGSVSLVFHPLCSTFCSIALAVLNLDGNRHVRNWDWADCVIWVSTRCLDWYGTSLNTVRHKHLSILNERILLC